MKTKKYTAQELREMDAAHKREVAELRECLRMAVVNTRIARTCYAFGRECDNCGQSYDAHKWNKVIGEAVVREATHEKSSHVGNAAKMRDALKETQSVIAKCMDILNSIPGGVEYDGLIDDVADELCDLRESYIEPALAEQKCEAGWELGAEYEYAYCSHCGHQQWADWDSRHEASENIGEFHKKYKFCPNCGFEMKGENDEQ